MIWEDEQEIIEELLYWQKRALAAEKKLENETQFAAMIFEWYDQTVTEKEYYKQQFLDKDEEMKKVLRLSGDR